jgi:polysaccharide biosynthesis protein PelA
MENSLRKDQLLLAQNYALYYGHNQKELLSRFDIAVIEPKGQSIESVKYLKHRNTLVIAYLSIMEVHPSEHIYANLAEEDFLFFNNQRIMNTEFGTYLVSMRSEKWIHYLLEEVQQRLIGLEVDGIFLDTIGDIEGLPMELRSLQLHAMRNFLFALKLVYPKHLLIQNNGLEKVCLETAPYIDGICWENPPLTIPESEEWVNVTLKRLLSLKKEWDIKLIFLLEETIEKERKAYMKAKKIAKENNILLYYAPRHYVDGVNVVKG